MRVKTIVNGKGEPQATEIAIPIEGGGRRTGEAGGYKFNFPYKRA